MESPTPALDLVWGTNAIAGEIGRTPRQTHYMLSTGEIPAKQVGRRWVIERKKLHEFFLGEAA